MKILEVEILTDNLNETEIYYSETLAFKIIAKNTDSITYDVGLSKLKFKKSFAVQPKYHFAFNIPNNKLEEAVEWASQKFKLLKVDGGNEIADFNNWNAKAFYFLDNNDNVLEFIARFDLNNQSDKKFESSSIQSISEIGIVTDNVNEQADNFIKEQNLNVYKNTSFENFVAIGDDSGLFIIVKTNRAWFPTDDRKAVKNFLRVKMQNNEQIKEFLFN